MSDYGTKPYGMNDLKIVREGTVIDLPVAQTLEFEERVVSGELAGDDGLAAVAAHPNGVKWKIGEGGIKLEALALMTGREASEAGSTPNRTNTLQSGEIGAANRYPYFDIYGKALGDGDDDIYIHVINAKITGSIQGSLKNQEFWVTEIDGIGLSWEIVQRETADDLPVGS
jgi:hypothetical protein